MKTTVRKWGNSLAVRIPKTYANEVAIGEGDPVDVRLDDGRIVVEPPARRHYELDDLLAGVTKANRHAEVVTDKPHGKEVW